jgi:sugar phosphate isomerase/epimerase
MQTRRKFLAAAGAAGFASAALGRSHRMLLHLSCGAIGVQASQTEAIAYAAKYGFDAVDADLRYLSGLSETDLSRLLEDMKSKTVTWALAGVPVEFRKDDAAFAESIKSFPAQAATLRRAGVQRMTTWISPASGEITYTQNMRIHAQRLREIARILDDHGLRLGLEYVGPKTAWTSRRFPFVHTMAEMKDLIGEIGRSNVGFVLDSWHWYTAGDTRNDLLSLTNRQVVSVDLNDAPAGIPVDQQVDSRRELPAATGVIDVKSFLGALEEIGFDGPVRAEPFNEAVRKMAPDQAIVATKAAIDKAFAQLG